jgi:inosine-uridine nucleoside N-ribohydrolase
MGVISKTMVRVGGIFSPFIREFDESFYQFERPFVSDASKYEGTFGPFKPTPHPEGRPHRCLVQGAPGADPAVHGTGEEIVYGHGKEEQPMSPTPVILDVDPGHDDAVAIMLACGSSELDLLAVTTVAGNVPLEKTTPNALRILSLIGHTAVPVAAGAASPLHRPLRTAEDIHGESGLEGPEIPDPSFESNERAATELIADTLREAPEPVILIPTGPLTNVARLFREHPELKERVARISLMGGSIGLGNTTPAAEFNVYVDPEAAREVFDSGLPITMSGLDVTHQVGAGPAERENLRSLGRIGAVVAELLEFFAGTYERVYGFVAPPLHDPVAVAAVMEPTLLKTRPMRVDVECESELTRGETVCDFYGVTGKPPNAEVGVDLDREAFFKLLHRVLGHL